MLKPNSAEIKEVDGVEFLKLTYDFSFSPENRKGLKVVDRMPFNIFIKRPEQYSFSGETPEELAKELLGAVDSSWDFNFFWHGFGADKEIWEKRIENEILSQKPDDHKIYIAADGLSMGEDEDKPYLNNGKFEPEDYAQQIVGFTKLFFGKIFEDSKNTDSENRGSVTVNGHSFGAIGMIRAIPKLSAIFGEDTTVNYVAYHPAYPGKANIFLTNNYLEKIFGKVITDKLIRNNSHFELTLTKLLDLSGHIPESIRTSIIGRLIYEIIHHPLLGEDQTKIIRHIRNAALKPLTLLAGARGLLEQSELSESEIEEILLHLHKKHQLIIFSSSDDNIVSAGEFLSAFEGVFRMAKAESARLFNVSEIPGGHYIHAMNDAIGPVIDWINKNHPISSQL